ncbi:MAG TPA: nucleoside deaminase [Clostridiales bacterium]|jgi:tRNA(adenine34) deaminase|nr:nucleoside deaminase [Clostridiales bacterium]
MTDEQFMLIALKEAKKALKTKDVPVGAVIVKDGKIISKGRNEREKYNDATSHAEIVAIRRANKKLKSWYLDGCVLYVTMEPCVMCAGAIINSRIEKIVFGASDFRFGCCGTLYNLPEDERFNHRARVVSGVLGEQCAKLLTDFFKELREKQSRQTKE